MDKLLRWERRYGSVYSIQPFQYASRNFTANRFWNGAPRNIYILPSSAIFSREMKIKTKELNTIHSSHGRTHIVERPALPPLTLSIERKNDNKHIESLSLDVFISTHVFFLWLYLIELYGFSFFNLDQEDSTSYTTYRARRTSSLDLYSTDRLTHRHILIIIHDNLANLAYVLIHVTAFSGILHFAKRKRATSPV